MGDERETRPRLTIEYVRSECGLKTGQVVELSSSPFVIGRAAQSNLHVDNPRVSRQHVEIRSEAERCFLIDMGSRNGTFLNGQRLAEGQRQPLKNGDEIQIGALLVLRFVDPATTAGDSTSMVLTPGLWLDTSRREVYVRRKKLEPPLPPKQFQLLEILVRRRGEVVAKDQIAEHVWPEAKGGVTDQMIDNLVARLRQRLGQVDAEHDYITRIRGVGLMFAQRE